MNILCMLRHKWKYIAVDFSFYRKCERCKRKDKMVREQWVDVDLLDMIG